MVGAHSNWRATEHCMDAQAVVGSMAAASTGAQHGDVVHLIVCCYAACGQANGPYCEMAG